MTFIEKYKQLQDEAYLIKLLTDTVYSTMYLEDQEVPKPEIKEIVLSVLKEHKLKKEQFLFNKISK